MDRDLKEKPVVYLADGVEKGFFDLKPFPTDKEGPQSLKDLESFYEWQGEVISEWIFSSLPQGTVAYLLAKMLKKAGSKLSRSHE